MATPAPNAAILTRTHWAGVAADHDIHLEMYEGDIEGSFMYNSIFRAGGLTSFKSVANQTNVWRGDRVGNVKVSGRKSGEGMAGSRVANEKFLITVDTVTYIRTVFDEADDWTSPDYRSQYSREHGIAHAKSFDEAHIIQLIKCAAFKTPDSLKGAFQDGIGVVMTGLNAAVSDEDKADIVVKHHRKIVEEFIERDQGNGEGALSIMRPQLFSILVEHKKLMNVEFMQGAPGEGGNNYALRRVGILNGIRVMETPRFPKGANSDHPLGPTFAVSAAEAKAAMVTFFPASVLVTVEAKPMTVRWIPMPQDQQQYLDSFTMYTVGQRRPDAAAVSFYE